MSRELLQQALMGDYPQLIAAVRQYLAQPAQEPVAWAMLRADGLVLDVICPDERDAYQGEYTVPLYAAPAAPAVPAVPAVPAWLPIESAPYGAGEVIAVNRDGGISLQAGNHLRDLIQAAQEDGDYCWHTHWMPPPAAPGSAPAAPAVRGPLTDEQIDEIWDGTFDSADPKRQLSFRQIITRAIEAHHGITGDSK